MKKLIVLVFGISLSVCANADQLSNLVERISKLEKRIAVLEDKCGIEEQEETDEKVDAFIREHFGVQVGSERSGPLLQRGRHGVNIKMLKPYGIFNKAFCLVVEKRVYGVCMFVNFREKYQEDSVEKQIKETFSKLCNSFGLQLDESNRSCIGKTRYTIRREDEKSGDFESGKGFAQYSIKIEDGKLLDEFLKETDQRKNSR